MDTQAVADACSSGHIAGNVSALLSFLDLSMLFNVSFYAVLKANDFILIF